MDALISGVRDLAILSDGDRLGVLRAGASDPIWDLSDAQVPHVIGEGLGFWPLEGASLAQVRTALNVDVASETALKAPASRRLHPRRKRW